MAIQAKFVHTNLIAEDWRSLAAFYQRVFGCEIVAMQVAAGAKVTWCYVTDPEGNILELQSWST